MTNNNTKKPESSKGIKKINRVAHPIRIHPVVLEKVRGLAATNNRSVSNQVEVILAQHFEIDLNQEK